jgi:hypothetical protein
MSLVLYEVCDHCLSRGDAQQRALLEQTRLQTD